MNDDKCCGNCCWFKYEDMDGFGNCVKNDSLQRCSDDACGKYISTEQARHYVAVLLCHNRWRRDNNVPSVYRMQDAKELGKAMDFAYEYIKTFMKL